MKSTILVTKDVLHRNYIEPYSNLLWKTPNIAELASKGTVFNKHYTAAPSTNMAVGCMFTGVYPYQNGLKYFVPADKFQGVTLFDIMHERGYSCHIVWANMDTYEYANCFGDYVKVHHFGHRQPVGPHSKDGDEIKCDDAMLAESTQAILHDVDECLKEAPAFIWMHLPHVIKGRNGYGTDIDWFDSLIGMLRERFDDDAIFISADHGHMNLTKGKCCYGWDVYEDAAHIPLITPRLEGMETVDFPTDNTQLTEIVADRKVTQREYVLSDTAYYGQPQRKLAIVSGDYKYIFNRKGEKEELYDLKYDPNEEVNLVPKLIYDSDRMLKYVRRQIYYYPREEEAEIMLAKFRTYKEKIWKQTGWLHFTYQRLNAFLRLVAKRYVLKFMYEKKRAMIQKKGQ